MRAMHPLREHRLARGWSLDDVAERLTAVGRETGERGLGVNGTMVGRWERGEKRPRAPYPKLLAALYRTTARDLGLAGSPHAAGCGRLDDDVERRQLLRLLAGALAAPVVGRGQADADRLAGALRTPSRADGAAASIVDAAIANARRLDDVSGSRVAVRPALAQREVIHALLRGRLPGAVAARLTAAAAELSQLLGWCAFDMNDYATARAYFDEGLGIAGEAGDEALRVYLLGHLSFLSDYEDHPSEALALAEAARGRVDATRSRAMRSWVAAVEAEALANLGDQGGSEQALDRARTAFAQARADEEPPWMYHFDDAGLESWAGTCYLRLGLTEAARRAMRQAIDTSDPSAVRERAIYLARLGQTYLPDGEVEEACRIAGEALAVAATTRCDRAVLRVREFRAQLGPRASGPVVRELDDQLASTAAWFKPVAV